MQMVNILDWTSEAYVTTDFKPSPKEKSPGIWGGVAPEATPKNLVYIIYSYKWQVIKTHHPLLDELETSGFLHFVSFALDIMGKIWKPEKVVPVPDFFGKNTFDMKKALRYQKSEYLGWNIF